jgi:hypothetical protein
MSTCLAGSDGTAVAEMSLLVSWLNKQTKNKFKVWLHQGSKVDWWQGFVSASKVLDS